MFRPSFPSAFAQQRHAPCFTAVEVFQNCRKFVYPPCNKLNGFIETTDRLDHELGFTAKRAAILALRTNATFQMEGPERFTPLEITMLQTVQDHVVAICNKLARRNRLIV